MYSRLRFYASSKSSLGPRSSLSSRTNSNVLAIFILLLLGPFVTGLGFAAEPTLNINTASPQELAQTLPGIGPAKAKAIVIYREEHGFFESLDALIDVKGIGPLTLEKIRGYLFVSGHTSHKPDGLSSSFIVSDVETEAAQSQMDTEAANSRAVQAAVNIARRSGARIQRSQVKR